MDKPILKGTKTEVNLMKAFAGESQARNRYTFFSKKAKKEGYEQISAIFAETAENERAHAKIYYDFMENSPVEINASFIHCSGNTYENLMCSSEAEHEEWSYLYPHFGDIAEEEGFPEIARAFRNIATIENHHDARFKNLAENIQNGAVFRKDTEFSWKCRHCGFLVKGVQAPVACPTCHHPQAYFEIMCDNF